ncbi:hypothetical protein BV898_16240 [Hypsibius exemplaris]|uniref:G-protein coupled receptors family 1 profile domain-containing protein n=1 Tax=Hypsibius exemplaris TaxID=2072580 RepID=A0A9X6NFH9_HYPEX|nr:hypothetical protein BV898_16240 [Hypsibius exemplaris]
MALNGLPLILVGIIVAAQLFNLIIFHLWRQKEPFVLFHVALAYYPLLISIVAAGISLAQIFPWSDWVSTSLIILFRHSCEFVHTLSLVTLLCISVDCWLSVEFAIAYRSQISKQLVRQVMALAWVVAVVIALPGILVNLSSYQVFCNRSPIDTGYGVGRLVWKTFSGPVILALLLLCQLHIVMLAVRSKVRQWRAKTRSQAVHPASRPLPMIVAHFVWGSLRASMVVLLTAVISELPYMVHATGNFRSYPILVRIVYMLPSIQHMYSPLIYLTFFPQFRAIVCRCFA